MKLHYLVTSLLFPILLLSAQNDAEDFFNDITDIATKTKLNIDYQPSVVSVLHAEKLKKIGIRNLHEAMALLPGIETSVSHTGWKQVLFRGAYNPDTFIFDKYKLYIDGVDIGSSLYSTSYYYLDLPIELIDRIEILRGSGSTIYGPGAFSGAINVITKSSSGSEDKIFASVGSYEYYKGGFVKHFNSENWKLALDAYYQANNKTLHAGESFVSDKEANYAREDYRSLENFKDFSIGLTAKNNNFQFVTRYKSETSDNYYGLLEDLEPVLGGYTHNENAILELQYKFDISKDISLNSKVGVNYYAFEFDTTLYNDFRGSGITLRLNPKYEQLSSYIDLNLNGTYLENHNWMLGINVQKTNTLKNVFGTTMRQVDRYGGPIFISDTVQYLDGEFGLINGNNNQLMKSIYFQDIYSINNDFDISLNLRFDDSSLFDEMFSYRMGGVYRLDDRNIFKAVYGRSHRVPSYIEAFQGVQDGFKNGAPGLKPEQIDTYELMYTYKTNKLLTRTNLFYSIIDDVIDSVGNEPPEYVGDYYNHQKRNFKGLETEFTYMFDNDVELMLNLSYVRTQFFSPDYYNPVEYRSPEISEVLSKGYLLYPINEKLSLNTAYYYNGPKKGYSRVERPTEIRTIDASMVVDETVAYSIDYSSMVTLSVKNLFNESVKYPSYEQKHDEVQREGRNWLLTYEKVF